ncbi:hypothetical protein LSAT2_015297 [Lamellibrachia satsuma]|nr:hypothetical protein LSAT2_015297 [Lamellibrachia satsuma]
MAIVSGLGKLTRSREHYPLFSGGLSKSSYTSAFHSAGGKPKYAASDVCTVEPAVENSIDALTMLQIPS